MKTSRVLALVMGGLAVASLATACGDNSAVCGEGTVAVDGVCVPDEEVECGPGTENVGGQCVPDGTVICEQGTVFDEASGTCVVDPSACAEGTVLVDGVCVPEDDALTADFEEIAEPNDGTQASDDVAGQFELPAVGESTTITGCINPYRDLDDNGNPDQDLDLWIITTTGPALVDITADGIGGLAAGYQVISAVGNPVVDDNFVRFGLNLTGDTSSRQVYFPSAGVYGIFMADSRSLFLQDGAAGSPEACYYTTVTNVALPTPTPAAVNTDIAATHDGDVDFFSADPADCNFFIGVHDMQAAAAASSFWAIKNGVVYEYGEPDGAGTPGVVRTGGLFNADVVLYVIDPVYNYALNPVDYTLRVIAPPSGPLPLGGGQVVITNIDDGEDFVGCYDITADTMNNFEINADDNMRMVFLDGHGLGIHDTFSAVSTFQDWIHFPAPGRYSVVFIENELAADVPSITVDSEVITQPIVTITPGTPIAGAAFHALGATWYRLNMGTQWLSFDATGTNWGSDVSLDFYDYSSLGVPDDDFFSEFFMDIPSDGSEQRGHIFLFDTTNYLVKLWDFTGTADETSTYDLTVANRTFTDVGFVTELAPIATDNIAIAVGATTYHIVRGNPGELATITVTPDTFDASVVALDRFENAVDSSDSGGDGAAEVVAIAINADGFVAFAVTHESGTGTDFDLDITSSPPKPYVVTTGALTFSNICGLPGAVVLPQTPVGPFAFPGDEAVTPPQTMPFNFLLHNQPASTYYVGTNGFIAFDTSVNDAFFTNQPLPTASIPNGLITPYWDDLENIVICQLATADTVTLQWTGNIYFTPTTVQFQAILHDDGVIEFVYSGTQAGNGGGASVGTETTDGTLGTQVSFNTAGSVTPSSSRILTPMP